MGPAGNGRIRKISSSISLKKIKINTEASYSSLSAVGVWAGLSSMPFVFCMQSHSDARYCWLTHLVRLLLRLRLRGNGWLSLGFWWWHCGRPWLSVCGGLCRLLHAGHGRRLAGLWVWSEAGGILLGADDESRCLIHQHPLHKCDEILTGPTPDRRSLHHSYTYACSK